MQQRVLHEPSHERALPDGPGLRRLVSEVIRNSADLVHNEVQLVKTEIGEKFSQVGAGAGSLAAGLVFANAALIVLLASAVIALSQVMEGWLAALIVGVVTALVAAAFIARGRSNLKARNLAPRASVESLERDAHMMKEHLR